MRLTTLCDSTLLIEQHMAASKNILRESCYGLNLDQTKIVTGIYNELVPLIEATLTAQQIQQIFGQVETDSTAAGSNRTLLGKGVDVTKKANEIINNIGKWLQNTTPVQAFDQKFENLKSQVAAKLGQDSKIMQGIAQLGEFAKENPGKTAAVIGILTALAAFAGGPVGGAIAGQVLKGATELLKGEKLSTAIGKGAKAAALGWLTGKAIDFIGSAISKPIQMVADKMDPGLAQANFTRTINEIGGKFGNRFETFDTGPLVGRPEDVEDILTVYKDAVDSWKNGDYMRANSMFNSAAEMTAKIDSNEYMQQLALDQLKAKEVADAAKNTASFFSQMANVAQGAATGAASNESPKESLYNQDRPLSEGQVYMVFGQVEQLTEGPMDALKGLAAKGVAKAQQVGHNITTKVTADKLNKAWQSAGSPTDSDQLADFLHNQGVDDNIVDAIYAKMKIKSSVKQPKKVKPAPATNLVTKIQSEIPKLDKKSRQRLVAYLQKQLGTTQ
jgi:hypothetical protein